MAPQGQLLLLLMRLMLLLRLRPMALLHLHPSWRRLRESIAGAKRISLLQLLLLLLRLLFRLLLLALLLVLLLLLLVQLMLLMLMMLLLLLLLLQLVLQLLLQLSLHSLLRLTLQLELRLEALLGVVSRLQTQLPEAWVAAIAGRALAMADRMRWPSRAGRARGWHRATGHSPRHNATASRRHAHHGCRKHAAAGRQSRRGRHAATMIHRRGRRHTAAWRDDR
mmetsp:Transcript_12356/g.35554  ORF Transcript_12356/g.35554 Transcript_12356/m.35554 type:complete len:223 (-) Transcript_12356:233-901(-)